MTYAEGPRRAARAACIQLKLLDRWDRRREGSTTSPSERDRSLTAPAQGPARDRHSGGEQVPRDKDKDGAATGGHHGTAASVRRRRLGPRPREGQAGPGAPPAEPTQSQRKAARGDPATASYDCGGAAAICGPPRRTLRRVGRNLAADCARPARNLAPAGACVFRHFFGRVFLVPDLGGPESYAFRHPGMPRPRGWAVRVPRWRDAAAEPARRASSTH